MKLIDRYMHALKFWLPKEQQEDIVAELREDLRAKTADKESELGRALSEDEVAAILRELGPPIVVAGRYLPQRQLIGPLLFPAYVFVLKLVLCIIPAVFLLIVGPLLAFGTSKGVGVYGQLVGPLFTAMFSATGVITIVFALLDRYPNATVAMWDPQKLPSVPTNIPSDASYTPWYVAAIELIVGLACSLVFLRLREHSVFDFGDIRVILLPIWQMTFWPIFAVLLSGAVKGLVSLLQPGNVRLRAGIRVGASAATLATSAFLLSGGRWADLAVSHLPADGLTKPIYWTNLTIEMTLVMIVVASLIQLVVDVRSLLGKTTRLEVRPSRS